MVKGSTSRGVAKDRVEVNGAPLNSSWIASGAPEQRVSLFRRRFWKKNLASTVQVAIMCHARKRALHSAIVGEQAQLPRVGTDAFGQSVLDVVA